MAVAEFLRSSFQRPIWTPLIRLYAVAFAGAALLAALFARIYVGGEDGIYTWDFRGYWDRYEEISSLLSSADVRGILRHLARIVKEDYNVSPVLALQPFSFLFTDSRLGYIVAIAVTYLVPAAFITAYLATLLARGPNVRPMSATCSNTYLPLLALALTFPPFWTPSLRGFPDVVGLIPLGLAATIAVTTDFAAKVAVKRAILFGLLLWACFLLRRWYAYAVVALVASSFLYRIQAIGAL